MLRVHSISTQARRLKKSLDRNGRKLNGAQFLRHSSTGPHPANVTRLVEAYRKYGHLKAETDPLGLNNNRHPICELDISRYDLEEDAVNKINFEKFMKMPNNGTNEATLSEIVGHLDKTYATFIGAEFEHLPDIEEREWFANKLESLNTDDFLSPAQKLNVFNLLLQSECFDHFLHKKFGQFKRYGLEGAEAMVPLIDTIFSSASLDGVEDVVIGMPHRGRLNFLVTLLQLPARYLFMKIKGNSVIPPGHGSDDVISHVGRSVDLSYNHQNLHVSLLNNPSHLEAVCPVASGKVRAKQDAYMTKDSDRKKSMGLMIHGDAALAGQGVVAETLLLSRLRNYGTYGSVHLIVNNQLGFTTPSTEGHSSIYNSDVTKFIYAPVLHVHGENPEAVVAATQLAVEYRNTFGKDAVIDLMAYRRHGHNEVDEPSFTNPVIYKHVRGRESIVSLYGESLVSQGLINEERIQKMKSNLNDHLEKELESADTQEPSDSWFFTDKWEGIVTPTDVSKPVDTGCDIEVLKKVAIASVTLPETFTAHERLTRLHVKNRIQDIEENKPLDWATAEIMAIGSILQEGSNVRIGGQDVERGTFSHRHAVFIDQETEEKYAPLDHFGAPGKFHVCLSPLSEEAVLGFEFGYSMEDPNNLTIWEAQFGDFFNGAQIIIDTYVSSSETKWVRQSGLVMLLPHGMDGTGPEHSSCRMERWLQLIDTTDVNPSQDTEKCPNMYVVNPTTPANYFHVLRRQMKTNYRKPLVVVGPKTLLRHPGARSKIEEMTPGNNFQPIYPDSTVDPQKVKKVAFVNGKLYYDLEAQRKERSRDDIAIVRIEEIAPFPFDLIDNELSRYSGAEEVVYCQEEHSNAGAWQYIRPRLQTLTTKHNLGDLKYTGRGALAAPAISVGKKHKEEHKHVTTALFEL